jgi:hypothetical protein
MLSVTNKPFMLSVVIIRTLSIMTFSITTLSINGFFVKLSIIDTRINDIQTLMLTVTFYLLLC